MLDSHGWLIGDQVVQAQQVCVAADFGAVACAGSDAASTVHGGVGLDTGVVAFLAILETGEVEYIFTSAVVGLASFDGHVRGAATVGAGEGARTEGVVSAARVRPAGGGELAAGWGVDCWTGGMVDERIVENMEDKVEDTVEDFILIMIDRVEVDDIFAGETIVETSIVEGGMLEDMGSENGDFEDALLDEMIIEGIVVDKNWLEDIIKDDSVTDYSWLEDTAEDEIAVEARAVDDELAGDDTIETAELNDDMEADIMLLNEKVPGNDIIDEAVKGTVFEALVKLGMDDESDDDNLEMEEAADIEYGVAEDSTGNVSLAEDIIVVANPLEIAEVVELATLGKIGDMVDAAEDESGVERGLLSLIHI